MALFNSAQHRTLLHLAREAVTEAVRYHRLLAKPVEDDAFTRPLGAFVTLKQFGQLRGCIGCIEALYPLHDTVIQMATSAALRDPRFPPVALHELDSLHVEISIMSPLTTATPEEVVVGTHGLVVEKGGARGLLLPQVPVEWGWDRETFLQHTCRKAGLPADAWQKGAKLYTFTAEAFSEEEIAETTLTESLE